MGKLLWRFMLLAFIANPVWAQERKVSGTVTSADGKTPLEGVTIRVQGVNVGTASDVNGQFRIILPPGRRVLQFSHVGYATQSQAIGSSLVVTIALKPASGDLGEVVVTTALGLKKNKRALGYSTQTVTNEQMIDKGDGNILNLLQGKVAGVEITGAGGSVGSSTNIILRGVSSITGSNQPLFVIDGVPMSNDIDNIVDNTLFTNQPSNRAIDLDPNTIESIDILQGPAGAALYGSRASAGAIIITTKKGSGQAGKTSINVNSSFGVQNVYGFPKLQNRYGMGTNGIFNSTSVLSWGPAFGSLPTLANGLVVAPSASGLNVNGVTYNAGDTISYMNYPDNMKNYFEQGQTWDNNLSILNGNAKSNYGFSVGSSTTKGILPKSDFNKVNIKFNAASQLTKNMNLSGSITYFNTYQNGSTTQGSGVNSGMDQLFSVTRSTNLDYYKKNYKNADGSNNWFVSGRDNPYFVANENSIKSKLDRFMGNVNLTYDILRWLKASYRIGIDEYINRGQTYIAIGSTQEAASSGSVAETNFYRKEINGDLILTANKSNVFTKGLSLTGLVGQNFNIRDYQTVRAMSSGLVIPDYNNVSNGQSYAGTSEQTTKKRLLGYYAQLSMDYNKYLFLEITGRMDQSSTLPLSNNTYFYPSVSSSFIFTDAFKIRSNTLSFGKIRAAYARVGKDADPYVLDSRTYSSASYGNNVALYEFPYGSTLGFSLGGSIGNPALKPEFTYSYELGFNLGFFKDRLNLEGTIYQQGSKNQIINAGLAPSSGFNNMVTNIGEISNKGVEVMVNIVAIRSSNFAWNISANFSKNKNKVVSLAPGVTSFNIANGRNYAAQIPSAYVGLPYGVILGNQHRRSPDGQYIIDPSTGLYSSDVLSAQVIADPNREWTAGLTNSFRFRNFTVSALVDFKKGGQISSWTAAILRYRGNLAITGENRDQPRILKGVIDNGNGTYSPNNIQIPAQAYWQAWGSIGGSDFNVFDATTFRFRELTLAYDIGQKILKSKAITNVRLALYARNLFFYAPNSIIDPEVNTQGAGNIRGIELQSVPNTRNFGGSLRLSF